MTAPRPFAPSDVDAIREVMNIGAGHAATALSQLMGVGVSIDVPRVWASTIDEVLARLAKRERLVVLSMRTVGDWSGSTLIVLRESSAVRLSEWLTGKSAGSGALTEDLERSSLQETANILSSSFLTALGGWLGKSAVPSVPTFALGQHGEMASLLHCDTDRPALVVETVFGLGDDRFDVPSFPLPCSLLLLLNRPVLDDMLATLRAL